MRTDLLALAAVFAVVRAEFSDVYEEGPRLSTLSGWAISAFRNQPYALTSSDMKIHPPGTRKEHERHKVEHVELLNNQGFWLLMGALILAISVSVMGIRPEDTRHGEAAPLAEGLGKDGKRPGQQKAAARRQDMRQQQRLTYENFTHLAFCVVSLYMSMLAWGVAQEFVMTNSYGSDPDTSEQLPSVSFLVLCNRAFAAVFSASLITIQRKPLSFEGFQQAGAPAISNLMASWCQYRSLEYISFALQTTAKSAKLLPVVLISSFRGKKQTLLDYAETLVIMSGLVVFGLETEADTGDFRATRLGVLLLFGLIIFDAATPHLQDRLFLSYPELDVIQAQFAMSSVACLVLFCTELFSGSLQVMMLFLQRHPEAILHIIVLSLSSTLTQYLISYSIKHFGPITVVLVTSTRQMIAICLSAVLFEHTVTPLAGVAALLIFGMVMARALRPQVSMRFRRPGGAREAEGTSDSDGSGFPDYPILETLLGRMGYRQSTYAKLLFCTVAIHIIYCFYAVEQEFLAYHTFNGSVFAFPLFIVAVNHIVGAAVSYMLLWSQGMPAAGHKFRYALLPAVPNFLATAFQYAALYSMLFPAQTIMKTLKIVPVMLVGRLCGTRKYTCLDYGEGMLITFLVTYFVWDFQPGIGAHMSTLTGVTGAVLFMLGYVVIDSFTCNLEDYTYQATNMDPLQLLFGMEFWSGIVAIVAVIVSNETPRAISFMTENPEVMPYIALLAMASASGYYTCTLTVRLFGPAVFTFLMVSRQIISLVISVHVFQHRVDTLECACLVVICFLVLTFSLRRVTASEEPVKEHHIKEPIRDSIKDSCKSGP